MRTKSRAVLALTGIGLGISSLAIAVAPSASAGDVTNPAQHPYPITVTIDGQTYHDGLDTLPGYDDYACTPIPDVQYDFAGNQVLYYDDSGNLLATAPWTEWSRISSYKTWQAQQAAAGSGGSSATKGSSGTKSGAKHSSSSSKTGSAGKSSSTARSSQTTTSDATATNTTANVAGKATGAPKAGHTNKAQSASGAQSTGASTETAQVTTALASEKLSKSVSSSLGVGAGDTRSTGLVVLGGLGAASLAVWLAGLIRGRRRPVH